MSVVIETTLGDITVDLFLDQRPITCLNFLKLCKMKYYNFNLFHSIRSGFIAQTGDPTGEGAGGESVWGLLDGPSKRFFSGEKMPKIRHTDAGLLSMVCTGEMMVGSQFFFTLGPDLDSLDGVHCVIGEVAEGHEILRKLNDVICDETHRPYQDVRITHTVVLEDPFSDPPGLRAPSRSPSPSAERLKGGRIAPDEELDETQGKTAAEVQEMIEEKEARARATILEIVGDLPDADIAPPENVLFVCKLNPVTTDEDLEIIFSRFGKIVSCEVIRDKKTGDSLQYAFIEFSDKKSCEDAYFKMDNVLIDDRRIHVDFSQSVSKMRWLGKGRGVQHFKDGDEKDAYIRRERSNRSRSKDRGQHKQNSRNKYSESSRNDDKHHNSHTISDKQSKHDRNATKSRSHRERSRSRSKAEKSSKKDKTRHSYSEDKAPRSRRDSSKTRSSNQKTERSNRTEEDRSRSRYEEKSRNQNDDRSGSRYDDKSQQRNPDDYENRREKKSSGRPDNILETRKDKEIRERNRKNTKEHQKEDQQISKNQEIPRIDIDKKHADRDQQNNPNTRHEKDTTEPKQKKRRDKRSKSKDEPTIRMESKSRGKNKDQSDSEKDVEINYKDKQNSRNEKEDGNHEISQKRKYEERHRATSDHEPGYNTDKNRKDRYDKSDRNKVEDRYPNRSNERQESQNTTDNNREKYHDEQASGKIEVRRHEERHSNRHKNEAILKSNYNYQTNERNREMNDIHAHQRKSQQQVEHYDAEEDPYKNRKTKGHNTDHVNTSKEEGRISHKRQERKGDGSHRHKDTESKNKEPKNKKTAFLDTAEIERPDREHVDIPTPSEGKRRKKEMDKKELKKGKKIRTDKKNNMKRKRKTSSSESSDSDTSDTSDSSSSSDTSSSSSDSDHKKRKSRKRKHSSSSSSSDSSSSSSSDSSSSDTSSSSSDSDRKKKNTKKPKQTENKPKRK